MIGFYIVNFRQFLNGKKQPERHSHALTQRDLVFKNHGKYTILRIGKWNIDTDLLEIYIYIYIHM